MATHELERRILEEPEISFAAAARLTRGANQGGRKKTFTQRYAAQGARDALYRTMEQTTPYGNLTKSFNIDTAEGGTIKKKLCENGAPR